MKNIKIQGETKKQFSIRLVFLFLFALLFLYWLALLFFLFALLLLNFQHSQHGRTETLSSHGHRKGIV